MPSYLYSGPGERVYPEGRDASGTHIGTVTPGDIRIFDEPPADGWWTPEITEGANGPHEHPGFGDVPMHGTEGTADGTFHEIGGEAPGSDEGAAGEPEPHGGADAAAPGDGEPSVPEAIPGE